MNAKKLVRSVLSISLIGSSLITVQAMRPNVLQIIRTIKTHACSNSCPFFKNEESSCTSNIGAEMRAKLLFSMNKDRETARIFLNKFQNFFGPNFLLIARELALTNNDIKTYQLIYKLRAEKLDQSSDKTKSSCCQLEDDPNKLLLEAIEDQNAQAVAIIFEHEKLLSQISLLGFHKAKGYALEIDDQKTLDEFEVLISKELKKLKNSSAKKKKKKYEI